MNAVSAALRSARHLAGLQQQDVAKALGISAAYLSDMEHGRRDFSIDKLCLLPEVMREPVAAAIIAAHRAEIARAEAAIPRGIDGGSE